MAKKINFETAHFKHERVQQAVLQYKNAIAALMPDDKGANTKAYALLEDHKRQLEAEVSELQALHKNAANLPAIIRGKKLQLLNKQMATIRRAIDDIEDTPDEVLDHLRGSLAQILPTLSPPNGRIPFEGNGKIANDYIEKIYEGSRHDTKKRYEEMDFWYAVGNEYAFRHPDASDRAYEIMLVPKSIRYAKWAFMLALADVAYNITYNSEIAENRGLLDNAVLSRLLCRLSTHERGADNPHMPYTHKLRHNPAIHSLHVVALADKLFHQARENIKKDCNGNTEKRDRLFVEWRKFRDRVMLMALLHDMGELDGELSQGIDRSRMKENEIAPFKKAVEADEHATFNRYLQRRPTNIPVDEEQWDKLKEQYAKFFDDVGNTDVFIGRFVKALERMQSQHDYLRFEGLNGATKLCDSEEENRRFSLNYVSEVLHDAPHTVKEEKDYGPKALVRLTTQGENPYKEQVCKYLNSAIEEEYRYLIGKLESAYNGKETPLANAVGRAH